MRTIDTLVIHCTATPDGSVVYSVRDIDAWHAARGFRRDPDHLVYSPTYPYIGYHGVIDRSGVWWPGRAPAEVGEHAKGHNASSLGYCLIGMSKFTLPQWTELKSRVQQAIDTMHVKVIGHREVSEKTCPGFDVQRWLTGNMEPLDDQIGQPS